MGGDGGTMCNKLRARFARSLRESFVAHRAAAHRGRAPGDGEELGAVSVNPALAHCVSRWAQTGHHPIGAVLPGTGARWWLCGQ